MKYKIAIASDHAGYELKEQIADYLKQQGHEIIDLGANSSKTPVDYPDYAKLVGIQVSKGNANFGVLICGTGIGMSIAANRIMRVRAALCYETTLASLARKHNNANVLVLGSRVIAFKKATWILNEFLNTNFEERHLVRINKLEMDNESDDK